MLEDTNSLDAAQLMLWMTEKVKITTLINAVHVVGDNRKRRSMLAAVMTNVLFFFFFFNHIHKLHF